MKSKHKASYWKVWLKTRRQKMAAFALLLMAVLGLFGDHLHLHLEEPVVPTAQVTVIASGGGRITGPAAITLPRLTAAGVGTVSP